ncbi:MAG: DUF3450 family protein [Myxococcota bacterium]
MSCLPTSAVALAVALILLPAASAKAPDTEGLAEELSRLRGEVEELSARVEGEKESQRMRLRSLATQKADLEIELRREEVRLQQATKSLEEQKDRVAAAAEADAALKPALLAAIDTLRAAVRAGLPYRVSDRLAELDGLATRVRDDLLAPGRGVARLWSRVEDELRLTRESALDRQVVDLGGEKVLADVVHVGTVMIFFRTKDGRYGHAERAEDGWAWREVTSAVGKEDLQAFFESFDKRVRVGFFEVPNPLEGSP